ncbi:filamentous hemagglutinin N-terminal domain-containing protein, partial [Brasilonema bromeliae]
MSFRNTCWFLGIAVGGAFALAANSASAQITPDATLPNNSTVTINGNTFNIDGGTTAGRNLFHSFQQFSVPTNGTASFNNAADIQNIFSRVTGTSVSNIDGIIKALGTANLFLINPNGIIFGKDASLNVGGSFVGTTANAIQFGNQGFFSATNPNNPALLTVNPSALFFNQIAAASITNNSVALAGKDPAGLEDALGLRVPDGKSLLLVGGNVNMDGGRLNAYGGRVELGGLAASGNVGLNVDGEKLSASFPTESALADVSLTNNAGVYVYASGGGNIIINARNLDMNESRLRAGIGPNLGSDGTVAGDIVLNAKGKITVVTSSIFNYVSSGAEGKAGNIQISADSLSLTNNAYLSASTDGKGDAGNVIIDVRGNVSFDNSSANTTVFPNGEGKGGNIQIKADSLSLTKAFLFTNTYGRGDAGNVIIEARRNVFFDNSSADTSVGSNVEAKGGNIQIKADSLSLNKASLSASTFGKGDAGDVIIDARGNVSFDNSSASTTVSFNVEGKGGNIQIKADSLSLNKAFLFTNTFGKGDAGDVIIDVRGNVSFDNSNASTSVGDTGEGKGGNVQIKADSLSLTNNAVLFASSSGKGDAGNVIIDVRGNVSFDNSNAYTSPGFTGEGKSGNIQIKADSLSLTNAYLSAFTLRKGDGGNVIIDARGNVSFDNSYAFTSAGFTGEGKGGNIQIKADSLSLTNNASLDAKSFGQGDAGNIEVTARQIRLDNSASFNAESASGNGGNINLRVTDLLLLRRGSQISTSAGTD